MTFYLRYLEKKRVKLRIDGKQFQLLIPTQTKEALIVFDLNAAIQLII